MRGGSGTKGIKNEKTLKLQRRFSEKQPVWLRRHQKTSRTQEKKEEENPQKGSANRKETPQLGMYKRGGANTNPHVSTALKMPPKGCLQKKKKGRGGELTKFGFPGGGGGGGGENIET